MGFSGGRKRVLIVLPELNRGGAEMLVLYMMGKGFSYEFEVSICVLCHSADAFMEQMFKDLGVNVYFIGRKRTNVLPIMFGLYKLMRRLRPHILHTHLYSIVHCIVPAALACIPVRLHTVHNVAWHDGGLPVRMAVRIASRVLGFILVGISDRIASTIREFYGVDHVPVIPNGIPMDLGHERSPEIDRAGLNLKDEDIVCINVANFFARKNHEMLLEAFRRAISVKQGLVLLLIGQGPLRGEIERMAVDFGIHDKVRFLGLRDDIWELLVLSDLFVLSSHTEGLPLSAMEAMAAGLPVLATDVGGLCDLVEDGVTGRLVEPGDVKAFADSIVSFSVDRVNAIAMGQKGRERIKKSFSIESTVHAHERLYLQLLGNSAGS
ncbi:glycosyltransferase [Nitrospirota bacterium]